MKTKDEVINYINSMECVGTLMLSGKWGSGKTFLINEIKKELETEYLMVIISLFGITEEADIDKKIKEQILYSYIHWDKKGVNIFKSLGKITEGIVSKIPGVSAFSPLFSINYLDLFEVEKNIKKPISSKENKDLELVIVFDDFERSNLEISDLLGIINKYSEGKEIKTVILLDEDKMLKDQQYLEFKEKVVYSTIKIKNDCVSIINNIIKNYRSSNDNYSSFICNNSGVVINVFNQSEYENYRTVKSALYSFERVFTTWEKNNFDEAELLEIFYKFLMRFFEYKHGNYGHITWGYGYLADKEDDRKNISDKYTIRISSYFPSILNQWIVDGQWEETALIAELRRTYSKNGITPRAKFLESLLWSLDLSFINEVYPKVLSDAYSGKLLVTDYISLVHRIQELNSEKIEIDVVPDYSSILSGLQSRIQKIKTGEIDEPDNHRCLSEISKYEPILREIYCTAYEVDDKKEYWKNVVRLKNILKDKNVEELMRFPRSHYIEIDDEIIESFWSMFITLDERENQLRALQSIIKIINCQDKQTEDKKQYVIEKLNWIDEQLIEYESKFTDSISKSFFSFCHEEINTATEKTNIG